MDWFKCFKDSICDLCAREIMTRLKRLTERLVPAKIFYLWERFRLRRIEIFTDTEKKPEIKRDTEKMPAIPTMSERRRRWMELTDKKERHRHGKSN
jgi:hypothetical protein